MFAIFIILGYNYLYVDSGKNLPKILCLEISDWFPLHQYFQKNALSEKVVNFSPICEYDMGWSFKKFISAPSIASNDRWKALITASSRNMKIL